MKDDGPYHRDENNINNSRSNTVATLSYHTHICLFAYTFLFVSFLQPLHVFIGFQVLST